jgi:hypothetical protein
MQAVLNQKKTLEQTQAIMMQVLKTSSSHHRSSN